MSPAQQQTYESLMRALRLSHISLLTVRTGCGKSTLLRTLHAAMGGVLLTVRDFAAAIRPDHPFKMEEAVERMLREAMAAHDLVLVDDLDLMAGATGSSSCYSSDYPRPGVLDALLAAVAADAAEAGARLVFATASSAPEPLRHGAHAWMEEWTPADYATIVAAGLGEEAAARLDFARIHRFAPRLNGHQLAATCRWMRDAGDEITTDTFVEFLRTHHMASNVDLEEVQRVSLADLKGLDDVIEALDANIVVPLENDEVAARYGVRPKRGVLLAGPPGTGKTTVGRALAHRLKSKFFLLDGTVISGTEQFYSQVHRVFEAATENAPSIIFIDDSDVIFESGQESGLYRYLLTMLDGLESQSAARVCVIMTAMDVGNLPPALVRSGRIELWLETRLPDPEAREAILRMHTEGEPAPLCELDVRKVAEDTDGLTGADLKRLVDDAKLLFAYDTVRGRPLRTTTAYFLQAAATLRAHKERYAEAEARARRHHPERPVWYDVGTSPDEEA